MNVTVTLPAQPKSKAVAVLLAIFLGLWAWVYTHQRDVWKFWLCFGLGFFTFGFMWFVGWIWAIIDTAIKSDHYYKNFPNV